MPFLFRGTLRNYLDAPPRPLLFTENVNKSTEPPRQFFISTCEVHLHLHYGTNGVLLTKMGFLKSHVTETYVSSLLKDVTFFPVSGDFGECPRSRKRSLEDCRRSLHDGLLVLCYPPGSSQAEMEARRSLGRLLIARYAIHLRSIIAAFSYGSMSRGSFASRIGAASGIANTFRRGSKQLLVSVLKYLWNVVCSTIYISRPTCACGICVSSFMFIYWRPYDE